MKPNCRECVYRKNIPGDVHLECVNIKAQVTSNAHARANGWFMWPFNFDPSWLIMCDGFRKDGK